MALDTVRIDYTNQLRTGAPSSADGQNVMMRGTNESATVIQEHGGRMQEQTRRGSGFIFNTGTSAALLLPATTGNMPCIWNPAGSNYVLYLTKLRVSFQTVGAGTTIGSVILCTIPGAGSAIGTGAPVVTFTNVAPQPALLGSGFSSHMKWSPATSTFTTAPAAIMATGINFGALAPTTPGPYETDFDSGLAIYPGNAIAVGYSVTTSTSTWFVTLWGYEVPMVAGQ